MTVPAPSVAPLAASSQTQAWRWDIFCRVIDNHGDLGVCWRLSVDLAERGHLVRLWVDDAVALTWMAPHGHPRVQVLPWSETPLAGLDAPGDVAIEAFGCELPLSYQAALAHCVNARPSDVSTSSSGSATRPPTWINLEYLSAETYVERSHGLPSPVMTGPARGLTKWFFYPGFTARTGGLIREPHLPPPPVRATQMGSPAGELAPRADIASSSQHPAGLARRQALRISLFCYEPQGLDSWLQGLRLSSMPIHLWVAAGRPQTAVKQCLPAGHRHAPSLNLRYLPFLTQTRYDHLLRHCDLNVVRGEDSLVRAIWAGRPLIWHIYPQADGVHHDKLDAFLALSQAPTSLVDYHRRWNADQAMPLPALTQALLASWQDWALAWRERLLAQPDLASQLIAFVRGKP